MQAHDLLIQLAIVLAAGLAGGAIARAVKAPVVVGFLVAGLVIGPHTPGLVADAETVDTVANLGVVLLMFSVGLQLSLREMAAVRKAAIMGGLIQVVATILLGMGVARALGWGIPAGLLLGCAIAVSSTAVMVRVLEERGELGTAHGLIMLGVSVVQDLAVVAMAVMLPMLNTSVSGMAGMAALGSAMLRAVAFVAGTLLLASRVVPWALAHVTRLRSRELFILSVVTICLTTALVAEAAGVELALGAFLAGLVVGGSDYADEVLTQVRPMRDVFASVFLVSIGMLLEPEFVLANWWSVLAVVVAIMIGKPILTALAVYLSGRHSRTSLKVGFGQGQIGEFAFVLAGIGAANGIVGTAESTIILASAGITLLLYPFVYRLGDPAYRLLRRVKPIRGPLTRPAETHIEDMARGCEDARAVVLGYGRIGRLISDGFLRRGIPHTVVDYDTVAVLEARSKGVAVFYGEASSDVVLKKAVTDCVEVVIVALPEAPTTEVAVRSIRADNDHVGIVARVHRAEDRDHVLAAGADRAVFAEDLAGLAMLEAALGRLTPQPEPANAPEALDSEGELGAQPPYVAA